ncbi:unnamed protein product [Didymodactylos carnosus]|uniref:D-isomer specific 2-hydroxyacid dehydrogenase catalytic domain-containing protein n=2 Tax=Didymodactylos carnosus TaxID=1234261 RepID=A0A814PEI0_9BILA|nr:unnamed protein product [Didymodactylos carnosus]CAF3871423.1 unnamed protein product [Didymodactylos carnosus]
METYSDMSNVLITDDVDQQCVDILQSIGFNIENDLSSAKNSEQLIEKMKSQKIIENSPHLKLIGRAGTGTDNIDTDSATKRGVLVMNTPGANTLSAAEHTCGLICSLSRSIPAACTSIKSGVWERNLINAESLSKCKIGVRIVNVARGVIVD